MAAGVVGAPVMAAPSYVAKVIGAGHENGLYGSGMGRAIGDTGLVTGARRISTGAHAFILDAGTYTDLGTLGGTSSAGWGINASGEVTGGAQNADGNMRAFLYSGGRMIDLGTLGFDQSIGVSINDRGDVVGRAFSDVDGTSFLYSNGKMIDLASAYGLPVDPVAINAAGVIAANESDRSRILVGGAAIDPAPAGARSSRAYAISNSAHVVGSYTTGTGATRSFLYTPRNPESFPLGGGTVVDIGGLDPASDSQALGVNRLGYVVGTAGVQGLGARAFLYSNGTMVDLNTLVGSGWTQPLTHAVAINDRGQIVAAVCSQAYFLAPSCTSYLLDPIDPPAHAPGQVQHGAWWNAPAGSQSGWGLNLAQQGDTIFVSWFTFDFDGTPLWLVASATRTADRTYSGTLYRTMGPALGASAFDPSQVTAADVGTATLTFIDDDNALFAYSVKKPGPTGLPFSPTIVSGSKRVTRLVFGAPVPTCTWGQGADPAQATNYTDMWWNAPAGSEPGWGLALDHQGETIFASWFAYGSIGKPEWMVMSAPKVAPATYAGKLYTGTGPPLDATTYAPGKVVPIETGSATLTFADGNNAEFAYNVKGVARTTRITRQVFAPPGSVCR